MMHVLSGTREHKKGEDHLLCGDQKYVRTNRGDEDGKAPTMGRQSIAAQRCRRVMGAIGILWSSYVKMYYTYISM